MTDFRMPPIRITYDNAVKRPTVAAERKSRVVGTHKAHGIGLALRLLRRVDAETAQVRH